MVWMEGIYAMSINVIISSLLIVALAAGLVDLLSGNRLGLGAELEKGIMSAGRLILIMTGFMMLAPPLSEILSPLTAPLLTSIGCDPSAFAGLFLGNDSGGAALAMEMAIDRDAGLYHGYIVGSMLGSTVMFLIALTMSFTTEENRTPAMYGLIAGIIPIPIGSILGGLVSGFDPKMVLINTIPCIVLSMILLVGLVRFRDKIVGFFIVFGKIMLGIAYFGLAVAALESILGITLIENTGDIREILYIIGNIALFLAGAFPLLFILMKILKLPLAKLGKLLQLNELEITGLVATLANNMPTYHSLEQMTPRGVLLNLAFIVPASCVFGDHLAYTAQMAPEMVPGMIVAKLTTAVLSMLTGLMLLKKVDLTAERPSKRKARSPAPENI